MKKTERNKKMEKNETLRTEERTTWSKIKIGEVFAYEGCWHVLQKLDNEKALLLCSDALLTSGVLLSTYNVKKGLYNHHIRINENCTSWLGTALRCPRPLVKQSLYKLPLVTQRLWKEE